MQYFHKGNVLKDNIKMVLAFHMRVVMLKIFEHESDVWICIASEVHVCCVLLSSSN